MSEQTTHRSLLSMGLHSRRLVRVHMLSPVHRQRHLQWVCECHHWTMEQRKMGGAGLMNPISFTSCGWLGACVWFTWGRDGTRMHYGKKASRRRQCDALLGIFGSWHLCGCYLTRTTYLYIAKLLQTKYTPSWQRYCLMAVALADPWRPHLATHRT